MVKTATYNVASSKQEKAYGKKVGLFKHSSGNILKLSRLRFQKLFPKLLLAILSVVLVFTILELVLRLSEKKIYDLTPCHSLDENFHHVMVPGSICRFKTEEWDVIYNINSQGLRDEELTSSTNGDLRILLLGDSFVQGHGVATGETFGKILEEKLNGAGGEKSYEVINAGVFAYSPLIEYLYLKRKGLALNPNMVILAFTPTDFWEDRQRFGELQSSYPQLSAEEIDKMIKDGSIQFKFDNQSKSLNYQDQQRILLPFVSYQIKACLRSNFRVYGEIVDFVKKKNTYIQQDAVFQGDIDRDILAIQRGSKISDEDWQKLWELPIKYIAMMKSLLDENNIPFMVVAIPDPMQVSDSEWPGRTALGFSGSYRDERPPFEEVLSKRLKKLNVPVINLLPEFRKSNVFPLYFKNDGHWRESGHRLAANEIFERLAHDNNLLGK